jgi:adenosylhomocysteinase
MRAAAFGAHVIVTEIDPVKAIEARMDGYDVMPMAEAAKIGDIFVTVTGCEEVITGWHMLSMKDNVILSNAGHFNVEVDMPWLEKNAVKKREARENIMAYELTNGKTVNVIAEGRLVNIAASNGHPAEIMDMSFAVQALSAMYILENHETLENCVIDVADEIDTKVAERKLEAWGTKIDKLTQKQQKYLESWDL